MGHASLVGTHASRAEPAFLDARSGHGRGLAQNWLFRVEQADRDRDELEAAMQAAYNAVICTSMRAPASQLNENCPS